MGGNVTSDNISPISSDGYQACCVRNEARLGPKIAPAAGTSAISSQHATTRPDRATIAAIVDSFLSKKLKEIPVQERFELNLLSRLLSRNHTGKCGAKPVPRSAVDFVSEDDVKRAFEKGEKIYISRNDRYAFGPRSW